MHWLRFDEADFLTFQVTADTYSVIQGRTSVGIGALNVRGHRKDQIRDFKQVLVSLEARAKSLRENGLGTTLPYESAIRGNKIVCTNKSYAPEGVQYLKRHMHHHRAPLGTRRLSQFPSFGRGRFCVAAGSSRRDLIRTSSDAARPAGNVRAAPRSLPWPGIG